jgi:DNA topoisomerase-1
LEELGIGRPSTYASIISTLYDRQYVEDNPKSLVPTTLGERVSDLLSDHFNRITGSELTAEMEEKLDEIARGENDYDKVLSQFWQEFKQAVETKTPELKENKDKYKSVATEVKCPTYGDKMVLKVGRYGEYYQNPNHPECVYPKDFQKKARELEQAKQEMGEDLDKITCPTCGAGMELKAGRFGQYFQCQDHQEHKFPKNFREQQAALQEARKKFGEQAEGRYCEKCGKELVVRVAKSSLRPYIACPEYKVRNGHTAQNVTYGACPRCQGKGREGRLLLKKMKGREYYICDQPKKTCGYREEVQR